MTILDERWTYEFATPATDLRTEPGMVPYGFCTDLVGVDGRRTGALHRFPGFRRLWQIPEVDPEVYEGPCSLGFSSGFWRKKTLDYFKYVEIQKGTTTTTLAGFVVRVGYVVTFHYIDSGTQEWSSFIIDEDSDGEIDVTFGGRFLWYVQSSRQGKTVFWWADELTAMPIGHNGTPAAITDTIVAQNAGAVIPNTMATTDVFYTVAVRLSDSRRQVYSPLRMVDIRDAKPEGNFCLKGRFTVSAEDVVAYDTIEIFRTLNYGGTLYPEIIHCVPAEGDNPNATLAQFLGDGAPSTPLGDAGGTISFVLGWGTADYTGETDYYLVGTMPDEQLILTTPYDWETDLVGDAPLGKRIYYADGVNYLAGNDTTLERCAGDIRFSRTDQMQPEVFPGDNAYSLPRVSDAVEKFVRAGDYIYGIARARLFRIARTGSVVSVERVSHGWGIMNRNAATEVGIDLALLGPSTLVLVAGATASVNTVGVIERVLTDDREWDNKSTVFLVYDAALSCLFLVNPIKEEAVCLWGTTNCVTRLADMTFVAGTSGPMPGVGGVDRAFFATPHGQILYVDLERENAKATQLGVAGTVNGVVTEVQRSTQGLMVEGEGLTGEGVGLTGEVAPLLIDSSASFDADLQDCYVYILSGSMTGATRKILGNTSTALTLDSDLAVEPGDKYAVSPVPMRVVGWPLGSSAEAEAPRNHFVRRKTVGLGINIARMSGETTGALITPTIWDDPYSPPLVSDDVGVTLESDDCFGSVSAGRPILFPGFTCLQSNMPLVVRSLLVDGTYEDTMES